MLEKLDKKQLLNELSTAYKRLGLSDLSLLVIACLGFLQGEFEL